MSDKKFTFEDTKTNLTRSDMKRVSETILLQSIPVNQRAKNEKSVNTNLRNLIILLSVVAIIILVLLLQTITSN